MLNIKSKRMFPVRNKIAMGILLSFLVNTVLAPVSPVFAQGAFPLPTSMVRLTPGYMPALIKGMRVYPENPLRFDFIVTPGDSALQGEEFNAESTKLMKYFLSSLTVPEKDLWVNLSPYEKDRIIPDAYGKTEMGRDMLAQDYILKQLTASVIYPDSELGKSFWAATYQKMQETFGSREGGVNTFNKIWIVPEKAVVYAKNDVVYVVDSYLKVMLEEDYLAMQNQEQPVEKLTGASAVGSELIRKMILPAIEKEVNEGRNFAALRQVYNSLILATWFKRNLKESILSKIYVGQNKINGVTFADQNNKEKIYADYVEAFKKGLYNIIKEDEDAVTGEMIPRKYFSGGVNAINVDGILTVTDRIASSSINQGQQAALFAVELNNPPKEINSLSLATAKSTAVPQETDRFAGTTTKSKASQRVFNLLRDSRLAGEQENVWSGRFSTDGRGELIMSAVTPVALNQLRRMVAVNAQSEFMSSSSRELQPIIEFLLAKLRQEEPLSLNERLAFASQASEIRQKLAPLDALERDVKKAKAEADELRADYDAAADLMKPIVQKKFLEAEMRYSQMQDRLVEMSLAINEQSLRKDLVVLDLPFKKMEYLREMPRYFTTGLGIDRAGTLRSMMDTTANLVNNLSAFEIFSLFEDARNRAQVVLSVFSKIKQDALNMDDLDVTFVLNAPEVFALTTTPAGKKVLQIDLMSFLREPNRAQLAMWRHDFLNIIAREKRVEMIRQYGKNLGANFITQNAEVAAETLRVLVVMRNVVDRYYGIGALANYDSERDMINARNKFISELDADSHYSRVVRLFFDLARQSTEYPAPGGKRIIQANMKERVETVLSHLFHAYQLQGTVDLVGTYSQRDVEVINELYINTAGSEWFSGAELTTEDVIKEFENDENEVELRAFLGADYDIVFPKEEFAELPPYMKEFLESEPGMLYSDIPLSTEKESSLSSMAVQLAGAFYRTVAEKIKETFSFNARQYVLRGALVVAGVMSLGNIGQTDFLNSTQALADPVAVVNVDQGGTGAVINEELKLGGKVTLMQINSMLEQLKKLQADTTLASTQPPPAIVAETSPTVETTEATVVPAVYKVKAGDTLSAIALKLGKKPVSGALEIAAANPHIENLNMIYPDQELVIPGATTVTMTITEEDTSLKNVVEQVFGKATPATVEKFIDFNPQISADSDLKPGMTITVILPVEQAQRLKEDDKFSLAPETKSVVAGGGPNDPSNVGGINLDPTSLAIESIGEDFKFDVPIDPQILQNLQQEPVNGFVPVILNVVPILNLPQFLGAQNSTETKDSLAFVR